MILAADTASWQQASPLDLDTEQAEREMILRRLLIEIGNDDLLAGSVVCSGGTTLQRGSPRCAATSSAGLKAPSPRSTPKCSGPGSRC